MSEIDLTPRSLFFGNLKLTLGSEPNGPTATSSAAADAAVQLSGGTSAFYSPSENLAQYASKLVYDAGAIVADAYAGLQVYYAQVGSQLEANGQWFKGYANEVVDGIARDAVRIGTGIAVAGGV